MSSKLKKLSKENFKTIQNMQGVGDIQLIDNGKKLVLLEVDSGADKDYFQLVERIIPKYDNAYVAFFLRLWGGSEW